MSIRIPASLGMLAFDAAARQRVELGIWRAVHASFAQDRTFSGVASPVTLNESRRRTRLAIDLFRMMREELSWAVDRCLASLPKALRCELEGIPFAPNRARAGWIEPDSEAPAIVRPGEDLNS